MCCSQVVTSREPLNISKLVYACDNVDCEKGDTEVLQRNEEVRPTRPPLRAHPSCCCVRQVS